MTLLKGAGDFFALDIGTSAVRVIQLDGNIKSGWSLMHYGYGNIDARTSTASDKESQRKLGEIILTVIGQSGIKTKNVVMGLPAQKSFTTVIDLPVMSEAELRSTIKYQIDQYIPMAIDEAKVDWVSLGQSAHNPAMQEVLLASTSNSFAEERLEFVEGLGLNVIAAEPDPIAMVRALLPLGVADARLLLDVGEQSTNLVVTYSDAPRLVRTIPTGLSSLVKAVAQNLSVEDQQARQFILKFGLAADKLEGQVYRAVENVLDGFMAEVTKSIKFFQTRYPNAPVGGALLTGYASTVPHFGEYLTSKTGVLIVPSNPWHKVNVNAADQQQLALIANEFTAAIGLAERENKL